MRWVHRIVGDTVENSRLTQNLFINLCHKQALQKMLEQLT